MRPAAVLAVVAGALAGLPAQAGPTAHMRAGDGQWCEVATGQEGGQLVVRLAPKDMPGGTGTLVINKPPWMRLEDSGAPLVLRLEVQDRLLEEAPVVDLGCFDRAIPEIRLRVADENNPINPQSLRLSGAGIGAPAVQVIRGGPPDRQAEFAIRLPDLQPGAYEGELSVADLSPQANTLRLRWRLSVFGVTIAPDRASVTLASATCAYRLSADALVPLTIAPNGVRIYATGDIQGWIFPRGIVEATLIEDAPERKVCRVVTGLGESDGKPLEKDKPGRFEFDLEVRRGLPCLIVTSRCYNELADGEVYTFWGWAPGAGYETEQGHQDWKMVYETVGRVGWVFLPADTPGRPGTGWISPLEFEQSRFGTMLLKTVPSRVRTKRGESADIPFAIMPAQSAAEVAEVAAKLDALGVWKQERLPDEE